MTNQKLVAYTLSIIISCVAAFAGGTQVQDYYDKQEYAAVGTHAFIRGTCSGDLSSCNGYILIADDSVGRDSGSLPYRITHGIVFDAGAIGKQATIPVLLPDACTGLKGAGMKSCKFIRDELPQS
ncbi:MAG: hypothetical protein JWL88_815 [Parcubacteria group bacterium]|nr:hypothetical protein [Parcubacteria group bacterium]